MRRSQSGGRSPKAIAGARFVELDSANHILLGDEPAWPVFTRELRAFLCERRIARPQLQR